MNTRMPTINVIGPAALHDQACAVFHKSCEPAVLNLSTGIFEPSWKAQDDGFYLVHANNAFKRWIVRVFLK